MDETTARWVTSEAAQTLLSTVTKLPGDSSAKALALRKQHPTLAVEHLAAVVAIGEGRERAQRRGFPQAGKLFVPPELLAQATSPVVAKFHAEQLARCQIVVDLCCGAGMDAIALAQHNPQQVIAYELDPARAVLAQANVDALGLSEKIEVRCGDCTQLDWEADGAFFDPARRTEERRVSAHGSLYAPPLDFFTTVAARVAIAVAKLSPALPDEILAELGGTVTFLSEQRECKEACVVAPGLSDAWSACLLPDGVRFAQCELAPIAETVGTFVLDPDPAVLRAGALNALCQQTDAALISPDDAYLTADVWKPSVGVRGYKILHTLPYRPKEVGAWLRAHQFGRVVVKKRRFPKEPDAVARELKLSGKGPEATLILVATGKNHLCLIAEPVAVS